MYNTHTNMAVTDGNWEFDKFDDGSTSKKDKSESSQNKFYKCALTLHIEIFATGYCLSVTSLLGAVHILPLCLYGLIFLHYIRPYWPPPPEKKKNDMRCYISDLIFVNKKHGVIFLTSVGYTIKNHFFWQKLWVSYSSRSMECLWRIMPHSWERSRMPWTTL